MQPMVESTTRGPKDYFHFGITFFGIILAIGGVVTTSIAASVGGLLLIAMGMAYFLMQSWFERD